MSEMRFLTWITIAVLALLALTTAYSGDAQDDDAPRPESTAESTAEASPETTPEATNDDPRRQIIPQLSSDTLNRLPQSGPVRLIVQLQTPSIAETLNATEDPSQPAFARMWTAAQAIAEVGASQRAFIETLTDEPFNARILSRINLVGNMITIEVDVSLLDEIRAMDAVKSVTLDRVVFPHGSQPGTGPGEAPGISRPGTVDE